MIAGRPAKQDEEMNNEEIWTYSTNAGTNLPGNG